MMDLVIALDDPRAADPQLVGGKGAALAKMAGHGFAVPPTLCLTTGAYDLFVDRRSLRSVIRQELGRKSFSDMRWEEIWDTALRIRNRFLRVAIPSEIENALADTLTGVFATDALAVRSSAPGEDSIEHSFAGLHDSIIGARGRDGVLEAVRSVWASLWTDRALLYRSELGIDPDTSSMAVVIQPLIAGEVSGIAFSVHPVHPEQMAVEAVYGLNQGLVDGTLEPDRWTVERDSGRLTEHVPPADRRQMSVLDGTTHVEDAPVDLPPLDAEALAMVVDAVAGMSELFGSPQDVEWTLADGSLILLQSRPMTTAGEGNGDRRSWYLSLTRSLDTLRELRARVEDELLPAMDREAEALQVVELRSLSDDALAAEVDCRRATYDRWVDCYWQEFIPLAHGIRLFGQFYNQIRRPEDPYEFMNLLTATPMLGLRRNRQLAELAAAVRADPPLRTALESGTVIPADFQHRLDAFLDEFGGAVFADQRCFSERRHLLRLLLSMADAPPAAEVSEPHDVEESTRAFMSTVPADLRSLAGEILDVGRASYRLRDDDNIHLGRLESLVLSAVDEGRERVRARMGPTSGSLIEPDQVLRALRHPNLVVEATPDPRPLPGDGTLRARPRQLIGQPAGPGVAIGPARIVENVEGLFDVQSGEILVCDAVDPNMTFVVPLCRAVVERRGGMLIHGAIIAREYGLPCVTGVPDATSTIETGDQLTVDGFLGIVTISRDR
jgi:pyruvate,water dikinase